MIDVFAVMQPLRARDRRITKDSWKVADRKLMNSCASYVRFRGFPCE
jgi:hypothetical protein